MKVEPFYLLEESEPYQEKKFLKEVQTALFGSNKPNIQYFDTKEHKFDQILEAANTFSMFASTQLIIVQQHKDLKEDDEEALLKYIDAPTASTTLIWKIKKLDKRKRFSKQVQAKKILISFTNPKPYEMSGWIDQIAKSFDVNVDRGGKGALVEYIGTNLGQVEKEMEKLKLYVHPGKTVQQKDVEMMVLKTSGDDVFAFTDQVINKDLKKAYATLAHLLQEGTVPLVLLSMLVRHYRILLKLHDGIKRRLPAAQLAGFSGIPPFLIQRYQDQTKKVSQQDCYEAVEILQKLDKDFKSTGLSNRILLENAVLELSN